MAQAQPIPLIKKRLERLAEAGHISQDDIGQFLELEAFVESAEKREDVFASYRKTNGLYMPLLGKVLRGLMAIGEPYAVKKHKEFTGEMGIMIPDVFSTPWDMTLGYLDRHVGNIEDVAGFYGL